jgi:hypothetical protein
MYQEGDYEHGEFMNKNKKPAGGHVTGQEQPASNSKAVTVIIILCFLGIMPLLVWVTLPETSAYTSVTTSNVLVQTSAASAGLQICSSKAVAVVVPGAQSAMLYHLSPDCSASSPASTVQILVVGFSSTDAQNAAIATAQNTHRNWQPANTEAFYSGYTVLVVQGAPGNQAVREISASLIEQGAVRVI